MNFNCFFLLLLFLVSHLRIHCWILGYEDLLLSSKTCIVLALTFKFWWFFNLIYVYDISVSRFIHVGPLYVDISCRLAICWKDDSFLINWFCPFTKNPLPKVVWVYFWALSSISLIYSPILMPAPYNFDYSQNLY